MAWASYGAVLRRRWVIVVAIVLLDVIVSGYLYQRAHKQAGSQGCLTLYVGDLSAPSLISAPQTTLETAGQALAGETAANFFADDILDVAQSGKVANYIAASLGARHLPASTAADFQGAVSGSRRDRTVNLCLSNPSAGTALAGAQALAVAMTSHRAAFLGPMSKRIYAGVISDPAVGPAPTSHALLNLGLRVILGVLVALGAAFLWDALDPAVRDSEDAERALGVPVLTSTG